MTWIEPKAKFDRGGELRMTDSDIQRLAREIAQSALYGDLRGKSALYERIRESNRTVLTRIVDQTTELVETKIREFVRKERI